MNYPMPIIRLEIEQMKLGILQCLPEHAASLDANIRAAIEAYFTPENISAVVTRTAQGAIDTAVKEEVRNFFQCSAPGRQAVRKAINKHLDDWYHWHESDEGVSS